MQQLADNGWRGEQLPVAHLHQHVFHNMAQLFQGFKTKKACCAFDAVDGAEDPVDDFRIGWLAAGLLQCQEVRLDSGNVFLAFLDKFLDQVVVVQHCDDGPFLVVL